MAVTNRVTDFTLSPKADNTDVELSVPVVAEGAKVQSVAIHYSPPECSLLGVTLNDTADSPASTLWKVSGKVGQEYKVKLSISEQTPAE